MIEFSLDLICPGSFLFLVTGFGVFGSATVGPGSGSAHSRGGVDDVTRGEGMALASFAAGGG